MREVDTKAAGEADNTVCSSSCSTTSVDSISLTSGTLQR